MTIESIIGFSVAMIVLAASPGPGVLAAVSNAMINGFKSALFLITGIIIGDIIFLILAILGLSVIAHLLNDLFLFVKVGGGLYLIWLGWQTIRKAKLTLTLSDGMPKRNYRQSFIMGLMITLGNPKAIIFYIGFLPTFIDLTLLKSSDILVVILLLAVILYLVVGSYSFFAFRVQQWVKNPKSVQKLNMGAGGIMIGTGVAILNR